MVLGLRYKGRTL